MVVRVTVTLPDDVLAALDGIASDEGVTRSDVVRDAAATYLEGRKLSTEAEARRRAVEEGLAWLEELDHEPRLDDRPSLEILREIRGDPPGDDAEGEGP